MFNIGFSELILILLVAFVIVGPKDLPKVARAIGRWVKYLQQLFQEFKDETGLDETMQELKQTEDDLKKTLRDADPTKEVRQLKNETEKAVRDAKRAVKADTNAGTK